MAREPKTTRRRLLAGAASGCAAALAGCSASGNSNTTSDNGGATTVPSTEVGVEFGAGGRIDLAAVESGETERVEITVVDGDGNAVTVDGLTVTISAGSAQLDGTIVRQVVETPVTVTFDGSRGLDLPAGASTGTLAVGVVVPPSSNYVDRTANDEIAVEG